jgi:hypothetical protein
VRILSLSDRSLSRCAFHLHMAVVFLLLGAVPAGAEASGGKPPTKPAAGDAQEKSVAISPTEAPQVLRELNAALEGLVAKVSPAVVQVLVTGYGPLEDKDQSNTALVVRQHAIGSGVVILTVTS